MPTHGRGGRRSAADSAATAAAMPPGEHAREIALRLLTRAPRSAAQLREGLESRGVDPAVAEEVIARYVEVGLLDDAGLAATIVRTRHSERGQSRRAIREELKRKGFDEPVIAEALDQIDEDDEYARAREVAQRRWDQLAAQPDEVRTRRVVSMLGRKGYGGSLAFALVRDLRRADSTDM